MKIFNKINKKLTILIFLVVLLVFSQWLALRMVYSHKIVGWPAHFFANIYHMKAGTIQDKNGDIDISLEDYLKNIDFANRLLSIQIANNEQFADMQVDDQEIADLVWSKVLKQGWLNKLAQENDIKVEEEDINYYLQAVGGEDSIENIIKEQGVTMAEYRYFLIEPDILEAKVYNYLLTTFADEKGVGKIQEAYMLLESENGENWDEVVAKYGEDDMLSENSFWLSDEELVDVYEAIKEVEVDGFSKIVQVPGGYVIWHVDSAYSEEDTGMREVRGLFVYAQGIDDFFDAYLNTVDIKRIY